MSPGSDTQRGAVIPGGQRHSDTRRPVRHRCAYCRYEKAEIYFAYHFVYRYTDEPFTSLVPDALFNVGRVLLRQA